MADAVAVLDALEIVMFVVLSLATAWQWERHRGAPAAWAALTFATLGIVAVAGPFVGEDPTGSALLAGKVLVALLVLFPYLLFRFTASLEPVPRPLWWGALVATAAVAAGALALDDLSTAGDRSVGDLVYGIAVLLQWGALSVVVATRLWRAGSGRPTVVRLRMRTLAVGALGLVLVLLLGVAVPRPRGGGALVDLGISGLTLAIGPLFVIGLVPPRAVVTRWRRPEEEALRRAEEALMAASSVDEVATGLLPHIAATLGSRRVRLVDVEGRETASHGDEPLLSVPLPAVAGTALSVPMRSGALTVEADPYAPFFGRDGTDLLRRLAEMTDIALRRAEVSERERATARDLAASNAAMREFVAVASHDLRTPISVVKGFAELLVTAGSLMTADERDEHLRTIARQADHLSTIVEDLLTVSRLDSGGLDPDPVPIALGRLAGEIRHELGAEGSVYVDVPDDLVAVADVDHVTRIVRNLVENARTYGEAPIVITGRPAGDEVELRVRDHGIGVPEAFRPRLFDRFAREDGAKLRTKHGTGLGLSIVRGLAQAAGGDAWFEPADPGACFAVRLPRAEERT